MITKMMPPTKRTLQPSLVATAFLLLTACQSEPARSPDDSVTPAVPADLGAANVSLTPAGESVTGTPPPLATCGAAKDLGVRLIGRHDGCNPAGPRQSWSGSGFVARFSGTGLNVVLEGPPVRFTTLVDEGTRTEFTTNAGKGTYTLVSGLPAGEHVVQVSRQGEASFGATVLHAVAPVGGPLLAPPAALTRRIEIIGDSITAGYGNEGTSPQCPFSAQTENHNLTYGALLARELQAELSTVAWSGKGVVSNYAGNREDPMPSLYDRAEPNDPRSVWDYATWQADVVLVNLGTNDYSTNNDPPDEEFTLAYTELLARIRTRYSDAHILCTVGPLLSGADLSKAETNIAAAVARRANAGDRRVAFHALRVPNVNPGCDWHPGLATHAAMANELESVLQTTLGW